jgi:hypothetical protein
MNNKETDPPSINQRFSKVTPIWKFVLLSICTFGVYHVFYFYKTWKTIKDQKELNISPLARAIFGGLFIWYFTWHVKSFAEENNIKINYSNVFNATVYFLLIGSYRLPDPFWIICAFAFYPLLGAVSAMNSYYEKNEDGLKQKKFSILEKILIFIGCLLFMASALGSFVPQ